MIRKFSFLLSILLFFPFGGEAQLYNFRRFNVEDGLAQSQVYAAMQDASGRLWLGTRGGGISVFDGFEYKSLTDRDGLLSNYINKIVSDNNGRIWVASNSGLNFFEGNKFKSVKIQSNGKPTVVRDLFVATDNRIFCATMKGIYLVQNGKATLIGKGTEATEMDVTSVYVDEKDVIWFGSDTGLFQLKSGKLKAFSEVDHVMRNAITTIKRDSKGIFYIGTYGDGMYCFNGQVFYRIDLHHELYRQTVFDVYFEKDNVWIATLTGGVINYNHDTKTFTSISEKEGLSNNHVRCILQDNNETFWFGTSGGGINQYLGKQFTNYDQRSGLAGNFIYSVLRDRQGNLWIGNSQKGVSVISSNEVVNYHDGNGFLNVKVKALAEDHEGRIWLGTDGHGVYVYADGEFTEIIELKRAFVKQIKVASDGHIWIATAGSGLIEVEVRGNSFIVSSFSTVEGLLSNRLTSLHFDKSGNLWYGTESNGIGCLNKNKKHVRKYSKDNGLNSNLIRCFTEDRFGRLWIGTEGKGICSIDIYNKSGKINCITSNEGLKSNNIYLMTTDQSGNLIVGSEQGLDYVFFDAHGSVTKFRNYGKQDGFTGVETCQNAVWNDKDGTIWVGTINALCRFNPKDFSRNTKAPILSLNDVKLFYESIVAEDTSRLLLKDGRQLNDLILAYSNNHIAFDFLAINLKRPEGVLYSWKLEGFDDHWSPPSKDKSILYSNLNPGKYVFLLKASNEDGVWNSSPLEFRFEILAPYWKQKWFITLTIIVTLLLIYFVNRIWMIRFKKKEREKQKQIEIEKEFLELEQKALRLQMNPHFIFNALNSIQSLIGTGKETEARYYLAKFSRLMRQILDNSRKNIITLQEEVNTLENYLLVEKFCNGDKFTYEIEIDPEAEPDFIKIPPMMIQPFVENAIKHGMKGRDENDKNGFIRISFHEKAGMLECEISDNGIGRNKASEMNDRSMETYHQSTSMAVIRERLNLMKAETEIPSLEIVDLFDDDGNATGTKVVMRIPIE